MNNNCNNNSLYQQFIVTASQGMGLNTLRSYESGEYTYLIGIIQTDLNGEYTDFSGSVVKSQLINSISTFVAKLDKRGKQIFFKMTGCDNSNGPLHIYDFLSGNISFSSSNGNPDIYAIGNTYVGIDGIYYDFNGDQITNLMYSNATITFVAKLSGSDGKQKFMRTILSNQNQFVSLVRDNDTSVYVTGSYFTVNTNYYDFDGTSYINTNICPGPFIYVAKFSPDGQQLFFTVSGIALTNADTIPRNIAIHGDHVYLTGNISTKNNGSPSSPLHQFYDFSSNLRTVNFTTNPFVFPDFYSTAFIAKLKKCNGEQVFMKYISGGNSNQQSGINIVVNDLGIFMTGQLYIYNNGYYNFDQQLVNVVLPLNTSATTVFISRFTLDGNQIWFKYCISQNPQVINMVLNDGIYIAGNMNNPGYSYDFEQNVLTPAINSNFVFVSKLDFYGKQQFFKISYSSGGAANYSAGISPVSTNLLLNPYRDGVFVFGEITATASGNFIDFNGDVQWTKFGSQAYTYSLYLAHINSKGEQKSYNILSQSTGGTTGGMYLNVITANDNSVIVTAGIQNQGTNNYYDFNGKNYYIDSSIMYMAFVAKLNYKIIQISGYL
ncbi:MAG: cell surface protein [Terrestrivirus sp.]|uniref:Cell surface protein n=1 Tax=Terrestrivirus sp. TaxID=2487775 RepID=A0A3G4ZKE7_9VIRU|nr:MAG: cell surface protein [Terrestrivirus sp.]